MSFFLVLTCLPTGSNAPKIRARKLPPVYTFVAGVQLSVSTLCLGVSSRKDMIVPPHLPVVSGTEISTSARSAHTHTVFGPPVHIALFNYHECLILDIRRLSVLFIYLFIHQFNESFNYVTLVQDIYSLQNSCFKA